MGKRFQILIISALVLSIASIVYTFMQKSGSLNIKTINSAALLNEYEGVRALSRKYENKKAAYVSLIDSLNVAINRKIEEYNQDSLSYTPHQKNTLEKEVNAVQQEIRYLNSKMTDEQNMIDAQLSNVLVNNIMTEIDSFSRQNDIDILINTGNNNILYVDEDMDITQEILQAINKKYNGSE